MRRFIPNLLFLLAAAPVTLAAGDSDAVNERIPVQRVEMEQHWGVDCDAALQSLAAWVDHDHGCSIEADLLESLRLCAYIYQPPGEPDSGTCPDYQDLHLITSQADEVHSCARLKQSLKTRVHCPAD